MQVAGAHAVRLLDDLVGRKQTVDVSDQSLEAAGVALGALDLDREEPEVDLGFEQAQESALQLLVTDFRRVGIEVASRHGGGRHHARPAYR